MLRDSDRAGARVLDAGGCVVAPGLVDLHTHCREPGAEETETVESAARAAALGGFTAFVAMPNTDPPIDCAPVAREVLELGAGAHVPGMRRGGDHRRAGRGTTRPDGGARGARGQDLHRRRDRGPGCRSDAAGHGLRGGPRRDPRGALRGQRSCGRRSHARRSLVEPARSAGGSGGSRAGDGDPGHRALRADRRAPAPAARVERRRPFARQRPQRPRDCR